ncbi:MAG: hypothetical protein AAGA99_19855 [Actinomycetota bacterium]
MTRAIQWIRTALGELWALIVDDGWLAVAALAAIGVTALLSRTHTPGTGDLTGWILVALVIVAVARSVRRAVHASLVDRSG